MQLTFLRRGANFIALNAAGNTPLDIASKSNKTDIFVDICENLETTLFFMNKRGENAFHLAATNCFTWIIQPHLLNSAKQISHNNCPLRLPGISSELVVKSRDITGDTPLHRWSMVSRKSLPSRVIEDPAEITNCGRRLLEVGALVNDKNSKDRLRYTWLVPGKQWMFF